jgi:uncharacterized protein involved in exopolysaccharide biosynthesis/Mrp family chromosome partitioning ATPase
MTSSTRPDAFELADYLGVLRRRWWIVLLAACLGVLVAGTYAEVAPKTYTAGAAVSVAVIATSNNQSLVGTSGAVNMNTEAQIVQSQSVAELAGRLLHSSLDPKALASHVSVTVPANTTVLDINCTQSTAARAATCANDFAAAYLSVRLASATSTAAGAVKALQMQVNGLTHRISQLETQLAGHPPTSVRLVAQIELDRATGQATALGNQIDLLLPGLASLQAPNNTLAGRVITSAVAPTSPSSLRRRLLLPSGLLAGLLIGLLVAFFVDRRDDRVHASSDVERYLGLPILLSISANLAADNGVALPRSPAGQRFAELAQYAAASLGEGSHILLVAGTAPGAGGSVVAANLAVMLARTHDEVVLVCAGLDGAAIPRILGVDDASGLAEVLAGSASVSEVARTPAGVDRLRVITPGTEAANALFSLQHDVSKRLMAELCSGARYVVIETQSVGKESSTFTLAEFADAAIVVIEVARTKQGDVADCLRRLERMRTAVLGAAVIAGSGGTRSRPRGTP